MCLFSKLTSVEFWSPCDVMPHNFLISLLACFPSHPFNNLFFFSCWWSYMYFIGFGSFAELQKWICSLLTQYLLKFYPILKFACEKNLQVKNTIFVASTCSSCIILCVRGNCPPSCSGQIPASSLGFLRFHSNVVYSNSPFSSAQLSTASKAKPSWALLMNFLCSLSIL